MSYQRLSLVILSKLALKKVKRVNRKQRLLALLGILLILVPPILYQLINGRVAKAGWWNDGWQYRKSIPVNNSGANQLDFQIMLDDLNTSTLVSAGKLRSDCGDLRFTSQTGQELPYWIESGCNTSTTDIWVKVDSIPTGGTTIYMYYGSPGAAEGSSGDKTFDLYDDFNDSSIAASKWSMGTYGSGGSYTEASGQLQLTASNNLTGSAAARSTTSFTNNFVIEWRRYDTEQHYNDLSFGYGNVQGYTGTDWWHTNFQYGYTNGVQDNTNFWYNRHDSASVTTIVQTLDGPDAGQWVNYRIIYTNTGNWSWYYNTGSGWTLLGTGYGDTTYLNNQKNILLSRGGYSGAAVGGTSQYDHILVRKYLTSPPTFGSPGSEEEGTGPAAYWSFDEGYGTTIHNQMEKNGEGGLIAWYKMDEVSGTSVSDETGLNGMTVTGSVTIGDGKIGKARSFPGGTTTDYVMKNPVATFPTTEMTTSFWIKTSDSGDGIIAYASTASDNDWLIYDSSNLQVYRGASIVSGVSVNDNAWHHVAVTWKSSGGEVKIYKDGKLAYTGATSSGTSITGGGALVLGHEQDSVGGGFNAAQAFGGQLDSVKIYNRARSAEEIAAEANSLQGHIIPPPTTNTGTFKATSYSGMMYGFNANYTTAHDTYTSYATTGTAHNLGQRNSAGYTVYRQYLEFDTSSIPEDATITSATLSLAFQTDSSTTDFDIRIYKYDWTAPLNSDAQNNYTASGATLDQTFRNTSGISLNTYYTSPQLDKAWIKPGGRTRYQIRSSLDVSSTAPTSGVGEEVGIYGYMGTGYEPTLTISYTTDSPGWTDGAQPSPNQKPMGKSMSFDGGNKYILIPHSAPIAPTDKISASGWFKPSETFDSTADNNQGILDKGDYQFYLDKSDGKAKWVVNDSTAKAFSALGTGASGGTPTVRALVVWKGDLYIGGTFTTAGGVTVNNIAKWDGSTFSALGSSGSKGTSGFVNSLTVWNGNLYVGGSFATADGVTVNNIAKWDGSSFSALGSGTGSNVNSLAVWNGNLYLGGLFTTAGGTSANYIAKWNGSSFSTLGSGTTSTVFSLAVWNGNLYVGGGFNQAGDIQVNGIAKWNGSSFSTLGSITVGTNGMVYSMAAWNDSLYLCGTFTSAGGVSANRIARWNGSTFSALGTGTASTVNSLTVWDGNLYVGGNFTLIGGTSANYIAKWDGSSFSALGSGTESNVNSLAVWNGDLYVGGAFTTAGGSGANYVAKWGTANNKVVSSTTTSWDASRWYHYATTYDGSNLKLYINGALESTVASSITLDSQSKPLLIGKTYGSQWGGYGGGSDEQFEGALDEMKIYRFALSEEQVRIQANRGMGQTLGVGNQGGPEGSPPIASWKFDEGAGYVAYDSSGNNNKGTLINMSTSSWVQGKTGKALQFDGSDDYLSPNTNGLGTGDVAHSVAAWLYIPAKPATRMGILDLYPQDTGGDHWLVQTDGTINAGRWNGGGVVVTVPIGQWFHFATTFDLSTREYIAYVNGVKAASNTLTAIQLFTLSGGLVIGDGVPAELNFSGKIDDLRIYSYARTVDQIHRDMGGSPLAYYSFDEGGGTTVHNQMESNGEDKLIHWWKMDETSGTTIYDTMTNTGTAASGTAPTFNQTGKLGQAIQFNSSGYFSMGDLATTDFGTGDFAVSFWFKTADVTVNSKVFLGKRNACTHENFWNAFITTTGNIGIEIDQDGSATNYNNVQSAAGFDDNAWHHVVASRTGTSLKLYVDGVYSNGGTTAGTTNLANTNNFQIANSPCASHTYGGLLDSVRIYHKALTTAEIAADYASLHGTAINGPTWSDGAATNSNQKPMGTAMVTNGSSSYLTIPHHDSLNFNYNENYTVSFWLKNGSGNANNDFILTKDNGGDEIPYYFQYVNNSVTMKRADGAHTPTVSGTTAINDDRWHHIVGLKNGSTLKLFIDGQQTGGDVTDTTTSITENLIPLYLGMRGDGIYPYNGYYDELKIYNYALTVDEVKVEYNRGSAQVLGVGKSTIEPTSSNLITWWKFDEGSGLTVKDSSSANRIGSLYNMESSDWVQGKFGKALGFGGSDEYVANLYALPTSTFTIEAWINPNSNTSNYGIFGNRNVYAGSWALYTYTTGQLRFVIENTPSADEVHVSTLGWIMPNTWTHVALVMNGTAIQMYQDGRQIYSGTRSATLTSQNVFCVANSCNGELFVGSIDNVKVFDTALTPAQIAYEYNQGKPIAHWKFDETQGTTAHNDTESNSSGELVAWWKMNEGAGSTVSDSIGPHTGTLSGATPPTWTTSGKVSSGLDFGSATSYVSVADSSSLGTSYTTVSAWIYPHTFVSGASIYNRRNTSNEGGITFELTGTGGAFSCYVYINGEWRYTTSTSTLTQNQWNHVACSYDGNYVRVYLNGSEAATPTSYSGTMNNPSSALVQIGRNISGGAIFDGVMDEIKVYNRARPVGEIVAEYSSIHGHLISMDPATDWVTGKFSRALDFDGTDDYVNFGSPAYLDNLKVKTISMWVNLDAQDPAASQYSHLINKGDIWFISTDPDNNRNIFGQGFSTTNGRWSFPLLSLNTWHHLVVAFDASSDTNIPTIYVDGIAQTVSEYSNSQGNMTDDSSHNLAISKSPSAARWVDGTIDEVKIYPYTLSADQVKVDYNNGAAVRK